MPPVVERRAPLVPVLDVRRARVLDRVLVLAVRRERVPDRRLRGARSDRRLRELRRVPDEEPPDEPDPDDMPEPPDEPDLWAEAAGTTNALARSEAARARTGKMRLIVFMDNLLWV